MSFTNYPLTPCCKPKAASAPQFLIPAKQVSTDKELLIDIYLYKTQTYSDTHTHTHGGIVGQKMTGAVMRETETLYSAPEMEGRLGDRGSDGERKVLGMTSPLPLTPPHFSPSPSHSLTPLPQPPSTLKPTEMHTRLEYRGTHTEACVCVCVCGLFKQSRSAKQTDMHVRLPWIEHPGTPLLFFSL